MADGKRERLSTANATPVNAALIEARDGVRGYLLERDRRSAQPSSDSRSRSVTRGATR